MTIRSALLPVALASALSLSQQLLAGVKFNDGDFTTYHWTASKILDTTTGQTGSFSAGEALTGGYGGGAYRSNQFSFQYDGSGANQGIIIGNLTTNMIYSPSVSGPLIHVTYAIGASNVTAVTPGTASVNMGLLLLQSNVYYTKFSTDGIVGNWNNVGKDEGALVASQFSRVGPSGPAFPDFSTNGAPIEFGYATTASLSSGSAATVSGAFGADNFSLSMSNTPTPVFISEQLNQTNAVFTLTGLAPGEQITWLTSTNLVSWSTNSVTAATATNAVFTLTNVVNSSAKSLMLRALVQ